MSVLDPIPIAGSGRTRTTERSSVSAQPVGSTRDVLVGGRQRDPDVLGARGTISTGGAGLKQEVVIVGETTAEDTQAMLAPLRSAFVPAVVVLLKSPAAETPPIAEIAPFTADYAPVSGRATAYVWTNNTCEMPTTDVVRFREQLNLPAP